jgi:hypothetical protein
MNQNSSLVISVFIALAIVGVVLAIVLTRRSGSKNQSVPAPKAQTKFPEASIQSPVETVKAAPVEATQTAESEILGTVDSKHIPIDVPESMEVRKLKLRERLGRSQGSLGQVFRQTFSG